MVSKKQLALNPFDILTIGYLIVVLLIILLFYSQIPSFIGLSFLHIFVIGIIILLVNTFQKHPENKILKFFRFWYPPILYTFLYEETGILNHIIFKINLDNLFQKIEYIIFRSQPSILFAEKFSFTWLNESMHFFYSSYYLLIPILGLILYKKDLEEYRNFIFVTSFTFYFCYLIYIFLPVVGPLIWELPKKDGIVFVPLMNFIYAYAEKPGAAFPSSHVAVALIVVFFAYKYERKFFYYFMIDVIFLAIATVYGRYHYIIDVFAGIVTAFGCYYSGNFIYKLFGEPENADPSSQSGLPATGGNR